MEELFVGNPLKAVEYLKKEMIYQIKMIKLDDTDFECDEVENIQNNIDMFLDCINGIYQDLITEYLSREDEIRVFYHPMGSVSYQKLGDEE